MRYTISRFLALAIGIESCLVMAGWYWGIDQLTRLAPFGINMKFPTALVFFFSAVGLYFLTKNLQNNDEQPHIIFLGISFFIFLIMVVLLISGLLHKQTDIEKLFVDPQSPIYSFGAGSPSIPTAINFILFGFMSMFSFFSVKEFQDKLEFFGYPIFVLGLLPIFGYMLHLPWLYYQFNPSSIPMAFNTAVSFVLLGLGVIIIAVKNTDKI